MKIVDIQERVASISSPIRNAYIDFSKMTVSVVALRPMSSATEAGRRLRLQLQRPLCPGGPPARAVHPPPRQCGRESGPGTTSTLPDLGDHDVQREPGGHGERSVAVGVIDMAVWDAVAKIEGKPLSGCSRTAIAAARMKRCSSMRRAATTTPGKDLDALRAEMQGYLDMGYRRREDEDRRGRASGGPAPHRACA